MHSRRLGTRTGRKEPLLGFGEDFDPGCGQEIARLVPISAFSSPLFANIGVSETARNMNCWNLPAPTLGLTNGVGVLHAVT